MMIFPFKYFRKNLHEYTMQETYISLSQIQLYLEQHKQ